LSIARVFPKIFAFALIVVKPPENRQFRAPRIVVHWGQALARVYFGAYSAAAIAAVVAPQLQQHPWL